MVRKYDRKDMFIVPVKSLQEGDTVRDFYSKDPSFGTVQRMEATAAAVFWDGNASFKSLKFRTQRGQRADIIRVRRHGELSPVEAEQDRHAIFSALTSKAVALSNEAYAYVRSMIDVDAGEHAPTPEVHKEVLEAFNIAD